MSEFKWTLLGAITALQHQERPLRPGTESQLTFVSTAGEAVFPIPKERMAELNKVMREGEAEHVFELELILRKRSGIPNTDDHPLHCPCRRCEVG